MLKDKLETYVKNGYIRKTKHPKYDLYIYNYTPSTQFEKKWNKYTKMARGLVLDGAGNIIARPFEKFFNLGELSRSEIPNNIQFEAYDKLDGSMGIIFKYKDEVIISTRGSFVSDQAIYGNMLLTQKYKNTLSKIEYNKTYLTEIIYPENRIVINYGNEKSLTLLAIIDNKTGKDLPLDPLLGFPLVKKYNGFSELSELVKIQEDNREGFVVKYDNGFRIKIKMDEYVRLHRIVTGVNNRRIWEYLKTGDSVLDMLDKVPDEFYNWVKKIKTELESKYYEIEANSWADFSKLKNIKLSFNFRENRKLQAEFIQTKKYPNILFAMLDGKDYTKIIWKMIKPKKIENPFENRENKYA